LLQRVADALMMSHTVTHRTHTLCCSVLQRVAVCCSMLQTQLCHHTHSRIHNPHTVLQCVAACCSVLQCAADTIMTSHTAAHTTYTLCCSALQRVAACCSVLQRVADTIMTSHSETSQAQSQRHNMCHVSDMLQRVAVQYTVLQCVKCLAFCVCVCVVAVCCSLCVCVRCGTIHLSRRDTTQVMTLSHEHSCFAL